MSVAAAVHNLLDKDARDALAASEPSRFQYRTEGGAYLNLKGLSLDPLLEIDEPKIAELCRVVRGFLFAAVADTSAANPNPGCYNPFGKTDCFVTHAGRWWNGVFTDLGTLPGGNNSGTTWASESGLIAGDSENGVVDPLTGLAEANAVLWEDRKMINLGTVPGGTQSLATAVNSRGQAVGFSNR